MFDFLDCCFGNCIVCTINVYLHIISNPLFIIIRMYATHVVLVREVKSEIVQDKSIKIKVSMIGLV